MINPDINATKENYGDELLITSVFYSLQGEGKFTGMPFIFIRTAGCNFGSKTDVCANCDTAFSLDKAKHYTVDSLLAEVEDLGNSTHCHNIILTGGEPTLQLGLLDFMEKWIERYPHCLIQIETNGTQPRFFNEKFRALFNKNRHQSMQYGNIAVCVSPKANEKTGRYTDIPAGVWPYATFCKFLVSYDQSSPYHTLPEYVDNIIDDVYISPITVYKKAVQNDEIASIWDSDLIDVQATKLNYQYAASVVCYPSLIGCNRPLKLSLQTHLFTCIK